LSRLNLGGKGHFPEGELSDEGGLWIISTMS
jgi:hypothetical protein